MDLFEGAVYLQPAHHRQFHVNGDNTVSALICQSDGLLAIGRDGDVIAFPNQYLPLTVGRAVRQCIEQLQQQGGSGGNGHGLARVSSLLWSTVRCCWLMADEVSIHRLPHRD